jgi:acetyl/propionyl-CoA carboxylase alpha subunit
MLVSGGRAYEVRLAGPDGSGTVTLTGLRRDPDGSTQPLAELHGTITLRDGIVELTAGAVRARCAIARDGRGVWVGWRGRAFYLEAAAEGRARPAAAVSPDELRAPMTGVLVEVRAATGAKVARDETLAVLEAMKMEYRLLSPRDGRVRDVLHSPGDRVELGSVVVRLEPEQDGRSEDAPARHLERP